MVDSVYWCNLSINRRARKSRVYSDILPPARPYAEICMTGLVIHVEGVIGMSSSNARAFIAAPSIINPNKMGEDYVALMR